MEIGQLCSVAVLAVLGSVIIQKFEIPKIVEAIIPVVLSILIVWSFGELDSFEDVLKYGVVSGLLAGGMLYILQKLTSRF